jgi:NinB protein
MSRPQFILVHDEARCRAVAAVQAAPDGHEVYIRPPNKSRDQEEHYHYLFGLAAKNCRHLNQALDAEAWKRLLVDQFRTEMLADPQCSQEMRENLLGAVRMMPSLDGRSIVALGLQTRNFKKATAAAFIEWLYAFLTNSGVQIPERQAA